MTEAEWLVCEDPQRMLEFLRGQSTQRKLRLFLCACCRHLWDRNTPKAIKRAIKVAEKYADAVVGKETFSKMQGSSRSGIRRSNRFFAVFSRVSGRFGPEIGSSTGEL